MKEESGKPKKVLILDCTLRDGSYLIGHQFTAEDTYVVALGLARAGFKLIEVGHGTGLGSSRSESVRAAASDERYLDAARSALHESDAICGMFFIPGIGKLSDLRMAAEHGMGFVRIGTNVTEVDEAERYVEQAKSVGLKVWCNLMKSYAIEVDEFLVQAAKAERFGADAISIVDSAGGMLPAEVSRYTAALRSATETQIGFHGHNNLQLAVANALAAVRAGADIVDSSLRGMGRSAGNAQTEVVAVLLGKQGYDVGVDIRMAMDLSERIVKPMMAREQGVDDMSLVAGAALFHSSYLPTVLEVARQEGIDPRDLIEEVGAIEKVSMSPDIAARAVRRVRARASGRSDETHVDMDAYVEMVGGQGSVETGLSAMAADMGSQSRKTGKETVLSLTVSSEDVTGLFVRQSKALIIGNVEAPLREFGSILETFDGKVDWILFDESSAELRERTPRDSVSKSRFGWYSEARVLSLSVCALMAQERPEGPVLVLAEGRWAQSIVSNLETQGVDAVLWDVAGDGIPVGRVGALLSFGVEHASGLTEEHLREIPADAHVYAARPDSYPDGFLSAARAAGRQLRRVDCRAALAAELEMAIGTCRVIDEAGESILDGIPVVAGGVIGRLGTVVVDSVRNPARVLGIADGRGGLLSVEESQSYIEARNTVARKLIEDLYRKHY